MPEDLWRLAPKQLSKEESRQDKALTHMLDSLDETMKWIRDLDSERREAMGRRGNLRVSIEAMLRAATYAVRCRHDGRFAKLGTVKKERPRKLSGPMGEVMMFLAEFGRQTVRAADITHYLKEIGVQTGAKYASKTLYDLARDEVVTKKGHGTFVVNHSHPDLVAIRLEGITRRKKRWGY